MVNAHNVIDTAHVFDAPYPPRKAVLCHGVPVIQRVAPQLPRGRKSVRRTARHLGRVQVLVQLELVRVAPYIDAVQRNVDGKIADNLNILRFGVILQCLPLTEKQVLHRLPKGDLPGVTFAGGLDGIRLAAAQRLLPLLPASTAVGVLQRHKQGIVGQPETILPDKITVFGRGCGQQPFTGKVQHGVALLIQNAIVDALRRTLPVDALVLLGSQQSLRGQLVQIDKIGIARIGGKRLVGAVTIAGRADGQNLPVRLPGFVQKIYKLPRLLPHGADTVGGRQCGNGH